MGPKFSPILFDLNQSRDAIVFIRGEAHPECPSEENTRMDSSRPYA